MKATLERKADGMRQRLVERLEGKRQRLVERFLAFKPYIKNERVGDVALRFFIGTPQAATWYDPLRPHNRAELTWLAGHLAGREERIIDAGAYHGMYTLVMAKAANPNSRIVAIDPVESNRTMIELNCLLNGIDADIAPYAVSASDGPVSFSPGGCGRIVERGGSTVPGKRLSDIMADATVAKIDIEGAEYDVMPLEIDALSNVHTWLVEIHAVAGRTPEHIINLFRERDYRLLWLNRAGPAIEAFADGTEWDMRSTLIALRR